QPLRLLARRRPRRQRSFATATRAQVWFEWRRTGLSLPIMTGLVLPFVLWPLAFGKNDVITTVNTVLSPLGIPLLLAVLAATTVRGRNLWVKDYYGVSPFSATLPMSSAALVGAKLRAAVRSTLATWALVTGAIAASVTLTGNLDEVADWWQHGLNALGPIRL